MFWRTHFKPLVFAIGFACGLAVAVALNAIPYWRSYGAYGTDGYEVAGFPFTFYRMGGIGGGEKFRRGVLLVDIGVAIALAGFSGWVAAYLFSGARAGRGFEVRVKSSSQVREK